MFATCGLCQCLHIHQPHWKCCSHLGPLLYCPALIKQLEKLSPPVHLLFSHKTQHSGPVNPFPNTCQKSTQFLLQLRNELNPCVLVGDYCEVNLCHNGGTCVTGVGEEPFVCICAEGFAGHNCTAKENGNSHVMSMLLLNHYLK